MNGLSHLNGQVGDDPFVTVFGELHAIARFDTERLEAGRHATNILADFCHVFASNASVRLNRSPYPVRLPIPDSKKAPEWSVHQSSLPSQASRPDSRNKKLPGPILVVLAGRKNDL